MKKRILMYTNSILFKENETFFLAFHHYIKKSLSE